MSFSKRAKRGMSVFNAIRDRSPKRARYHSKRMTISFNRPPLDPKLAEAALAALNAMPEEMKNAYVPELSVVEDNAKPESPEGGEKHGVSTQLQAGQKAPEGKETGPAGA